MKKLNFNPTALTAGIALALGVSIATSVFATTDTKSVSPSTPVAINNIASATYSVDGVAQPTVQSNAVVVNITENGSFTLVATLGASSTDDKNENLTLAAPDGSVTFTNTLTNTGNVSDTYTINLSDNASGIITGVVDKFAYTNIASATISVTIKNPDGTTAVSSITSGQTITLIPGQSATLSYTLKADGTGVGGDSGLATITATSKYITAIDTTRATLTNENQSILKLPVFAIVKSAVNRIDLNSQTTIPYTIKVTNDNTATYAADATNILIQDAIPAGLALDTSTIKVTGTSDPSYSNASTANLLKINGINLKVGETATITFTANIIDKAALAKAGSVTNNADVYDNYDNSTPDPANPQIYDSTGSNDPTKAHVPNDGPTGPGADTPSVVTFSDRSLSLTGSATAELPVKSGTPATYTHTITNNGNNPESGLTFTITNPSTTDNITPQNVIYTAPDGTKTTLSLVNGVYTIPSALAAGASGTISYDVVTTNATPNTSETNTITLTPAVVAGTTTPTVTPVSNTTTVKDMTLVKEQALDAACDGTADTNFSSSQVTATPAQCVIYRITATNNFTTKALTDVQISDDASQWNTQAAYVANSIKDAVTGTGSTGAGSPTAPGTFAISSKLTIAPAGTGVLMFAIKINQ